MFCNVKELNYNKEKNKFFFFDTSYSSLNFKFLSSSLICMLARLVNISLFDNYLYS